MPAHGLCALPIWWWQQSAPTHGSHSGSGGLCNSPCQDSKWHLLAGPLAVAVAHVCLWSPRWWQQLAPAPRTCVSGALLPESPQVGKETPMAVLPIFSSGVLPLWWAQVSSECTLSCHSPTFSGCLHAANPGPIPGSDI